MAVSNSSLTSCRLMGDPSPFLAARNRLSRLFSVSGPLGLRSGPTKESMILSRTRMTPPMPHVWAGDTQTSRRYRPILVLRRYHDMFSCTARYSPSQSVCENFSISPSTSLS